MTAVDDHVGRAASCCDGQVDPVLPPAVGSTLRDAGLRPAGPLGIGGTGPRWSAVDPSGARWAVTVVCGGDVDQVGARLAAMSQLDHPDLARVGALLPMPDGRALALVEAVAGIELGALASARDRLTAAEVAGVVARLAGALDALHAAGLAHGDVSPSNVVVAEAGPVLVDLVAGASTAEAGTHGYASPTRRAGPSASDDVYALGRVGLALLGAGAEGGRLAAGRQGVGRGEDEEDAHGGRAAVAALCGAACSADPADRPTAAQLAAAASALPTEGVRLPAADVLARVALRTVAGPAQTSTRSARGRHRQPRRVLPAVSVAAAAAVAVGLVTAVLVLPVGVPVAAQGAAGDVGAGGAPREAGAAGMGAHAVALTVRRAGALAAGDGAALRSVTVPGSRAALADLRILAAATGGPAVAETAVAVAQVGPVSRRGPLAHVRVSSRTTVGGARGPARSVELVVDRASGRVVEVAG